jgi:hypothetical protein
MARLGDGLGPTLEGGPWWRPNLYTAQPMFYVAFRKVLMVMHTGPAQREGESGKNTYRKQLESNKQANTDRTSIFFYKEHILISRRYQLHPASVYQLFLSTVWFFVSLHVSVWSSLCDGLVVTALCPVVLLTPLVVLVWLPSPGTSINSYAMLIW